MGDKPLINTYTCETCNHVVLTRDEADGTTPFKIPCVQCGGVAVSAGYEVDQTPRPVDYVWRLLRQGDPIVGANDLDHMERGGLVLYHPDVVKSHGKGRRADVIPGTRVMFHKVTPLGEELERVWVGIYYGLQRDRDYEIKPSANPGEVMRRRDAWASVARVAMEHGMKREQELAEAGTPMSDERVREVLTPLGLDVDKLRASINSDPFVIVALMALMQA